MKTIFDIAIRGNPYQFLNTRYTHIYIYLSKNSFGETRWKVHFDRDARPDSVLHAHRADRVKCNQLEAGRDTDESNPFVTRPRPARRFRVDSVPRDRNYFVLFNRGSRDFPRLRLRKDVRFLNPAN